MVSCTSFKIALICVGITILSGCSTSSTFSPYPAQLKTVKTQIEKGQFATAATALGKKAHSSDKILYLMEQGRVSQLAGDYRSSQAQYAAAIAAVTAYDNKALYTATGGVAQTSAVLINDNAIPYNSSPYELTMLHTYQALNYAILGDLEGALVEVRQADAEQKKQINSHQAELVKANEAKAKLDDVFKNEHFRAMQGAADKLSSSFQNAYTYYLSGVLYEAAKLNNDARIDYKKALALSPNNGFLQSALARVSNNNIENTQGQLIVIFEENFIPSKKELALPLPTGAGLIKVTLPFYEEDHRIPTTLVISNDQHTLGNTQALANLQALASKTLSDNLNGIVAREVARQISRITAEHAAENKHNLALLVATNIYALMASSADLRSWLTLPHNIALFSTPLPPGKHTIGLNYLGTNAEEFVNIVPGKMTLIIVQSMQSHLLTHVINL